MAAETASLTDTGIPSPEPYRETQAQPRHIAIIMDGNGRWARARGLPRTEGHRRGVESVRRTVRSVAERGIACVTLFGFSSENWSRPPSEVSFLLDLLRGYIRRDLDELHKSGVRIKMIGERRDLPDDIAALIEHAEELTVANHRLVLQVAFNYGGRDEIVRAAKRIAADSASGRIAPEAIDESLLSSYLDTADLPEPDLLIRTSGEQRISNFLLWQCAYTEFVFLDVLWPDFDAAALDQALAVYGGRTRRFGGISPVET